MMRKSGETSWFDPKGWFHSEDLTCESVGRTADGLIIWEDVDRPGDRYVYVGGVFSPYRPDAPMTSAEFKCAREMLGLSTRWLAERWGVSHLSVQRWERDRSLPEEMARDIESMVRGFRDYVRDGIERGDDRIIVPRTDADCISDLPSTYYRRAASLISARTHGRIVFSGDRGDGGE